MVVGRAVDDRIWGIEAGLCQLGVLSAAAVDRAVTALADRDRRLAAEVVRADDLIDQRHLALHDKGMALLAGGGMAGGDLRFIGAALQVAAELERIADHAVKIASCTLSLTTEWADGSVEALTALASRTRLLLDDALLAFGERNLSLARSTACADSVVVRLHSHVVTELAVGLASQPSAVEDGIALIRVADALERVGDRATNICEWTIYIVTHDITLPAGQEPAPADCVALAVARG